MGNLARRGTPRRPEDLASHDAIVIPRAEGPVPWRFAKGAKTLSLVVKPRLSIGGFELAARAAAAGAGIVRIPSYFAQPHLGRRDLVPVLAEWTPAAADLYAVCPPGATLLPKTRLFLDALVRFHGASRTE